MCDRKSYRNAMILLPMTPSAKFRVRVVFARACEHIEVVADGRSCNEDIVHIWDNFPDQLTPSVPIYETILGVDKARK